MSFTSAIKCIVESFLTVLVCWTIAITGVFFAGTGSLYLWPFAIPIGLGIATFFGIFGMILGTWQAHIQGRMDEVNEV